MGGGQQASTKATVPKELKPLYAQTGTGIMEAQNTNPVTNYFNPNPTTIAPLSGTQSKSLDYLNQNLDQAMSTPLENDVMVQAANRYFDSSIAPGIENRASLSGLGRSTALTNALSSAEAQSMVPILQGAQARRDQMIEAGFRGGDVERAVEQQGYNAEQQDALRRQALAEQALFGPMNQLPSTFGQKSSSSGGGLFK